MTQDRKIPVINLDALSSTQDSDELVVSAKTQAPKELDSSNKCASCNGSKCCQYSTVSIETPRSIREFDNLLWHVSHHHTHAFKDVDGWYLLFYAQCQHLLSNGFCGIYQTRPFVCREHTNDECEYDLEIDEGSELYFKNHEELDQYCRKRFKSWDKRFEK